MKVLTLPQPFASLVVWGECSIQHLDIETDYRGPLAIFAAPDYSPRYEAVYQDIVAEIQRERYSINNRDRILVDHPRYHLLPRGLILGTVHLVATFPTARHLSLLVRTARAYADVTVGRSHFWEFANAQELLTPFAPILPKDTQGTLFDIEAAQYEHLVTIAPATDAEPPAAPAAQAAINPPPKRKG